MSSLTLLPASASRVEAQPLFATPRNPHRDTLGGDVAKIATRLGKTPMPWQRDLFDIAYELDPETGTLWYREIVVLLMRQQGKTTCMLPVGLHRAIAWADRQNILYTAQTRKAARRKFLGEQVPLIKASPFWRLISDDGLRETNGDEGMTFERGNGSWWGIDAPTEQSGHGETLGGVLLDEYWWQTDNRVEQAVGPAMITVDDAQKWVFSTAGTARSAPLRRKRDAGRERVKLGIDSHTLYLEYAIPEDEDIFDPRVWPRHLPALGYTITTRALAADMQSLSEEGGEDEVRRAYGNQWLDTYTGNWIIPEPDWSACADEDSEIADDDSVVWSVDVAPDMASASISLAGLRADGLPHVEVVENLPGTSWAPYRMRELQLAWGGEVWADMSGPVGSLGPRFKEAGVELQPISGPELAKACGALKDAVLDHRMRHIDQRELNVALSSADRAKAGDAWKWTRGRSLADISSLYSVTIAHWKVLGQIENAGYDPLAGIQ